MGKTHARDKYPLEEKIETVQRYQSGETRIDLAMEKNMSPSTITNWIKQYENGTLFQPFKEKKRVRLTDEQKMEAVQEIINGKPLKEVVAKYNTNEVTLYNFMKDKGITYRSNHGRKHQFNEHFFDNINNQIKAYWLGFIMADGCISRVSKIDKSPNRLSINISKKDRILLEMFCDDIGYRKENIRDYFPHESTFGINEMCRLDINSKTICDALIQYDINEAKTSNECLPKKLNPKLYKHFIRGLFDGDGSIRTDLFRIQANTAFAIEIQTILINEIGLTKTKLHVDKRKSCDIVEIHYGGRNQLKKIRSYLYTNAKRYLPRKKERFDYYK